MQVFRHATTLTTQPRIIMAAMIKGYRLIKKGETALRIL
jgi:pyruvate dehydrogenase complex dehydrogenase (E1) component